jgi:hypothetical protein
MSSDAIQTVKRMDQHSQAQYSLEQQLSELYSAALKLGLYDAADFIKRNA